MRLEHYGLPKISFTNTLFDDQGKCRFGYVFDKFERNKNR